MLQKLYPSGCGNSPANSFKLVLLSEGYLAAEQRQFTGACVELVERLLAIPPFNLTRVNANWLSVYRLFIPSANAGPAAGVAAPGRTAFESAVDNATGALTASAARVSAVVDAERLRVGVDEIPLADFCVKGDLNLGITATLLALLLPPAASGAGAELEHEPGANDYHFVATTQNGEWHQVVARGMCRVLGLGDEYERAGSSFLAPADTNERFIPYYNVDYFDAPPQTNGQLPKWWMLFGPARRSAPAVVHAHPGDPNAPDLSVNAVPASPDSIELWEGGAGFRTKVYRTAKDCLLRRRIGDSALPVRQTPVPFCLACRTFLRKMIA